MRHQELNTLQDTLAILSLPVCAILLILGVRILWANYKVKREERRKAKARREGRVYLQRM